MSTANELSRAVAYILMQPLKDHGKKPPDGTFTITGSFKLRRTTRASLNKASSLAGLPVTNLIVPVAVYALQNHSSLLDCLI